jgi:DUF4097 and DUF4098 domain-containing protein YvlB
MKTSFLALVLLLVTGASAYCGGLSEADLVNEREIGTENMRDIVILYQWESITVLHNSTDTIILKEYMSEDNPRYYAGITNAGNTVTIERGRRPVGLFLNSFNARVEVFIPKSYMNSVTIKTTSGNIELLDEFVCSTINMESSSGNIRVDNLRAGTAGIRASSGNINAGALEGDIFAETSSGQINLDRISGSLRATASSGGVKNALAQGNVSVSTGSGNINLGAINGDVSLEASGGNIRTGIVEGNIRAETMSGNINCSAGETMENIALASTSGGITLAIPRTISSNFSARSSSGGLSTPFPEKLFNPVSDRNTVQGIIGGENPAKDIAIKTNSGSIRVDWIQ